MWCTRASGTSRPTRRFAQLSFAVLTLVMAVVPATAVAEPVTLKFRGTADLTPFGGTSSSSFSGSVTWFPEGGWVPEWEGCPDFCLDGSPDAASATFVLDSVSYTDRIEPFSRLSIHGWGGFFLDLLFAPALDLDGAGAPDVGYFGLNLWSDPADGSIFEDSELPIDLTFHNRLNKRSVEFADVYQFVTVGVSSDTVSIVPEPSSMLLTLGGLAAGVLARRRVRRSRCFSIASAKSAGDGTFSATIRRRRVSSA